MRHHRRSFLRRACGLLTATVVAGVAPALYAADTGVLAVSAVVVSKSNCKFSAGATVLDFGTIDPAGTTDAPATLTPSKTFSCAGSAPTATFLVSAGNGLHYDGASLTRRVRHSNGTDHMAYSLTVSPTSATVLKNEVQTLSITGKIAPAAYQNALAGSYSDTVTITLTP